MAARVQLVRAAPTEGGPTRGGIRRSSASAPRCMAASRRLGGDDRARYCTGRECAMDFAERGSRRPNPRYAHNAHVAATEALFPELERSIEMMGSHLKQALGSDVRALGVIAGPLPRNPDATIAEDEVAEALSSAALPAFRRSPPGESEQRCVEPAISAEAYGCTRIRLSWSPQRKPLTPLFILAVWCTTPRRLIEPSAGVSLCTYQVSCID